MADMLKLAGLRLEGRHHCGLDDSRNIGRILELLWRRGRRSFEVRTAPR
jgi:inhibitor of KinA sporulation pathway (predicted exonuclease)